jgi:hypothetical protein
MATSETTTRREAHDDLTRKTTQLEALIVQVWGDQVDVDTDKGAESEQSKLLWLAVDLAGEVKRLASAATA